MNIKIVEEASVPEEKIIMLTVPNQSVFRAGERIALLEKKLEEIEKSKDMVILEIAEIKEMISKPAE